jgi:hypothetical protein
VLAQSSPRKSDAVHLALSHVTSLPPVPLLSAALLVMLGTALVLHGRGSGRGSNSRRGNRQSGRPRVASRIAAGPDPRFAAPSRFAPNPGGHLAAAQSMTIAQPFAAAQSIAAAQPFVVAPHFAAAESTMAAQPFAAAPRLVPDPGDLFVAQPDLHLASQPDLHVVVTAPSWSVPPAASVSVLAALTEGDRARPSFAPSNSGDAFPTRARALSLLGGHLLAALGIFTLSLAAMPIGHHMSHVGSISVWLLATVCVFVGVAFAVVVAARVQHDIMGGGWYGRLSPRYISPQVALYVISPSGISAAARRLNSSPARVIFVEYGLVAAAFLVVLHRLVGR